MSVKIHSLELENIKRIKAVKLEPRENGLTVIGGDNAQGKTSVLDAIAWALGGNRFKPSNPTNEESLIPPHLKIELSNGLVVERTGKNSDLKVIDPEGKKNGQMLLDAFINELALNLPKFLSYNNKDKCNELLKIIGIGEKLNEMERLEASYVAQREAAYNVKKTKRHYADELPVYDGVPDEPIKASELIKEQQGILARNGEKQKKRSQLEELIERRELLKEYVRSAQERMEKAQEELHAKQDQLNDCIEEIKQASRSVEDLQDESTAEIEQALQDIEEVNDRIRANKEKQRALMEAEQAEQQYDKINQEIQELREDRRALLDGSHLPLPGLGVDNGELTYMGQRWDCMSSAEQLKVGTAIVKALKPECGFVLVDKLELMDTQTLQAFADWCQEQNLQVIGTRVSTGDECSIIITDGYIEEEKEVF